MNGSSYGKYVSEKKLKSVINASACVQGEAHCDGGELLLPANAFAACGE
jgi:hypothetical protein